MFVKFDKHILMLKALREIAWVGNALKEFGKFPVEAKRAILGELTLAAEGEKGDISKPMKGLEGPGFLKWP